jgi:hypothetical protein
VTLWTNYESEVCAEILRGKGRATNLIGAALSALVVLIAAITKLTQGAWVVVVLVPVIVMASRRARTHYERAGKALTPPLDAGGEKRPVRVAPPRLPRQSPHAWPRRRMTPRAS